MFTTAVAHSSTNESVAMKISIILEGDPKLWCLWPQRPKFNIKSKAVPDC